MNACLRKLLQKIGTSHNVPPKEVAKFFGQRSLAIDVAVNLPFILLYSFLAALLAGRLRRRYPPEDGRSVALAMIILSSLAFGIGGVLMGEQWSTLAENIRVGNGHLSYRVNLLPWARHRLGFFVLCMALFWGAAAVRYRARQWNP